MKKLSVLAIVFIAIAMASCWGNKGGQEGSQTDSLKTFEQGQIEAAIKANMDSIAKELGQLKQVPFIQKDNNSFSLTAEEKQVKPDYLLAPSVADEATTLAEKYRILSALSVDRKIASLYEMPTEDYDKAIAKLSADINDPSFKVLEENSGDFFETSTALYDAMNENGRINSFWQLASAALVEQLYITNQNSDKFLSVFDDEAASNVTYRLTLVLDAIKRLTDYDSAIKPVAEALAPLEVLNATSLDELKTQLAEAKDNIAAARKAIIK